MRMGSCWRCGDVVHHHLVGGEGRESVVHVALPFRSTAVAETRRKFCTTYSPDFEEITDPVASRVCRFRTDRCTCIVYLYHCGN
jgi:hypothetical protein